MKRDVSCNLTVILFSSLIFLLGCNKDDNGGSPTQPQNHPPVVQTVTASPPSVQQGGYGATLTCLATDADRDSLTYYWSCAEGYLEEPIGVSVTWSSPSSPDTCIIQVIVSDGVATDEDSVSIVVY
jgi:hypothetical protein